MIGITSSRLLSTNSLRAFQTLSAPKKATSGDNENKRSHAASAVVGQWKLTSPIIQSVTTTVQFSSLSAMIARMPSPSSYQNAAKLFVPTTTTTRSMAGVPESHQFRDGKPTLEYAKKLPKTFASMTNEQILHFSELGIPEACRECIVRDVMVVDQVEYDEAMKVFKEIAKTNRKGMNASAFPFYFGLGISVTGAYASIPLVFNLECVEWFNHNFVTTELPPEEDLETWLEVGSASWGWMEPVLGQVSFFLLCMQFARSQLQNLGIRPYFHWQQERRAAYLVGSYPQYDAEFLVNYSKCDRLVEAHELKE